MDADDIARTGDASYRERQRLVIRESALRDGVTLVERLAAGLAPDAA
ncbi:MULTISPECIES: hypothetical protein [Bradyrhizobium]|nr:MULTISPECIES: hypothetical protein [Bradyrhizobium]